MADTNTTVRTCASCARPEFGLDVELMRCAKCKTTLYCSRICQMADWKTHRKVCANNAAAAAAAAAAGSSTASTTPASNATNALNDSHAAIDKPFHRLEARTWLHDRPEQDMYKLLIDTYRFRMEDNYNLSGDADSDSIYGGARNGLRGFQRFLRLAESKHGLLPAWWSPAKATECGNLGMRGSGRRLLACAIEKSDVVERYGTLTMPMQLGMLGEQIYGSGPGGQDGTSMRRLMMATERGGTYVSLAIRVPCFVRDELVYHSS